MNRDNTLVDRWEFWAALPLLAVISVDCGAIRNPTLKQAHNTYQQTQHDPEVVRRAAVSLDKAGQTLEQAERAWTKEKDTTEAEHLAYIAEKRVEIARATARRRLAADEIQQLKSKRE